MSSTTVDRVQPRAKWVFDREVAAAFDDMLSRSIPAHDDMRRLVFDLGSKFVQPKTDIVDIGCSRGAALAPFVEQFGALCRYIGLEVSEPMLDAARHRFGFLSDFGMVDIRRCDLRDGLPALMPSLLLSVLTLQFVPLEFRQRVVADAYRILRPGGAMIVVEKCLGTDAATQGLYVEQYHRLKLQHGYSLEQIDAKAKSLQGVLVSLTPEANESMLRVEGFKVSRFWQHLNFVGWLAVKPGVTK